MLSELEVQFGNTYDSELSETSANAVQNKVVTEAIYNIDRKKQNVIADLNEIRNKTNTALQEHQDISHLATKTSVSDGLNEKVDKVSGKGLSTNDFTNNFKTKLEGLNNYNDSEVKNLITAETNRAKSAEQTLTNAITTINGTGTGSIKKTVTDEIAKVVNSAPAAFDTLKEIADYINEDQEAAAVIANKLTEQSNAIAENKSNITELSEKIDNLPQGGGDFNAEGNYPLLHVGIADDLAGRGESVPAEFGFRASGGKSIKDGRAYIKRIKGNSVVWNQGFPDREWDVQDGSLTREGETYIVTPTGEYPGIVMNNMRDSMPRAGDKVLILCDFWTEGGQHSNYIAVNLGGNQIRMVGLEQGKWLPLSLFLTADRKNPLNATNLFGASTTQDTQILKFKNMRYHNLTRMFQAGNEPTTIEEFYARVATLRVDLNAYNEGEVIHCNTESIKSVGDNAWDEEWIAGRLSTNTGQPNLGNNGITSKNYIRVLPNETYYCGYNAAPIFAMFYDAEYALITGVNGSNNFVSIRNTQFTTPANASYMRFYVADDNLATYNNDILISLYHSGWKAEKDDQYQPYWQDTLPLPIIRKYFPDGMKKAGTAHDEIRFNKASGKWEYSKGKIKSVDLGQENFTYDQKTGLFNFTPTGMMLPSTYAERMSGILCSRYSISNYAATASMPDKSMMRFPDGLIYFKDSSYTDAATFKAAMAGVMLYYESNDWEWVELDEADQNFRDYYNVADFGTEQSQSSVPSAAFSADIIYQFNAVDMIREHELEITELQKVIATMQAQLASLTSN